MSILFFASLIVYFAAAMVQFIGVSMKKAGLTRAARLLFMVGFALHSGYRHCGRANTAGQPV